MLHQKRLNVFFFRSDKERRKYWKCNWLARTDEILWWTWM